jgi:hypothetical protein
MLLLIGSVLYCTGIIWLVITAIQIGKDTTEKVIWAVVNLLCQPISGIIFFIVTKRGSVPLQLVLGGIILLFFGGAMSFMSAFNKP